jgi:hypothetical protein
LVFHQRVEREVEEEEESLRDWVVRVWDVLVDILFEECCAKMVTRE